MIVYYIILYYLEELLGADVVRAEVDAQGEQLAWVLARQYIILYVMT